jgi:uncharacterized membrane protein (DUF4010 family)
MSDLEYALRLGIAALIGLGVGVERQWSGHATGAQARFAGMRTLTMLGLIGGLSGLFLSAGHAAAGAATVAGGMAIVVAAYVMTVRQAGVDPEATTEVAAAVVIALGVLAGIGRLALAGAAGALIVLALHEKERLHHAVTHVRQEELRAAARFSVLALVILPLLPEGPVLGALEVRPRALWIVVLLFSAINFAAFVARRAAGPGRGYGIVGMLGGLISSTAVTLDFARRSRAEPALSRSLASGVVGACTVLIPRVLVVSAVLNARVALALLPLLALPLAVGSVFVVRDWRQREPDGSGATAAPPGNPLRLAMAIRMALLFQIAMTAIDYARARWPTPGLYATAAALGLTDVDALTVGMSRPSEPISAILAARAISVGILANTALKLSMAQVLGTPAFRSSVLMGLGALAAALGLALALF